MAFCTIQIAETVSPALGVLSLSLSLLVLPLLRYN
jgi:hypothetical protein